MKAMWSGWIVGTFHGYKSERVYVCPTAVRGSNKISPTSRRIAMTRRPGCFAIAKPGRFFLTWKEPRPWCACTGVGQCDVIPASSLPGSFAIVGTKRLDEPIAIELELLQPGSASCSLMAEQSRTELAIIRGRHRRSGRAVIVPDANFYVQYVCQTGRRSSRRDPTRRA